MKEAAQGFPLVTSLKMSFEFFESKYFVFLRPVKILLHERGHPRQGPPPCNDLKNFQFMMETLERFFQKNLLDKWLKDMLLLCNIQTLRTHCITCHILSNQMIMSLVNVVLLLTSTTCKSIYKRLSMTGQENIIRMYGCMDVWMYENIIMYTYIILHT